MTDVLDKPTTNPISIRRHGDVMIVTSNNPPVNALGAAVRQGLVAAIEEAEQDETVKAVVIACEGQTFFAGADITEFGKPPVMPWLPTVVDTIENCSKPVVAAIHGTVLNAREPEAFERVVDRLALRVQNAGLEGDENEGFHIARSYGGGAPAEQALRLVYRWGSILSRPGEPAWEGEEAHGVARGCHVRRAVRLGQSIFRLAGSDRKGPAGAVHRLHPRRRLRLQEQGLTLLPTAALGVAGAAAKPIS